jgi:uncharacterized protein (DUF169 family)
LHLYYRLAAVHVLLIFYEGHELLDIKNTSPYTAFSNELRNILELEGSPVAVAFSREPPSQVPQAIHGITVCMMLQNARYGRTFWASGKKIICGARAHLGMGQTPVPFIEDFLVRQEKLFHSREAARNLLTNIKKTAPSLGNHVIFSPLENANFTPDVVVFVATPAQISRVLYLDAFKTGDFDIAHQEPLCAGSIAIPATSNRIGISFLDIACRYFGKYRPEEMTVGVPFTRLLLILENIKRSAAGSAKQSKFVKIAGNFLRRRVSEVSERSSR